MPPCGGRAQAQRAQQEAELGLGLLGVEADQREHALLRPRGRGCGCCPRRSPGRSAPRRRPARAPTPGSASRRSEVLRARRREGVVRRVPPLLALVPLHEREVDDPDRAPRRPRRPGRGARRSGRAAAEHGLATGSASATRAIRSPGAGAEVVRASPPRNLATGERSAPSSSTAAHTRPLAPELAGLLHQLVAHPCGSRPAPAPGTTRPRTTPPRGDRALEHAEARWPPPARSSPGSPCRSACPGGRCRSGAWPRRGSGAGTGRSGRRPATANDSTRTRSISSWTSAGLDEGGLDVELGELGLAVGPQVLVAEAADDLVVALQAAHHQELLEELRALGQRVPGAALQAARHQEVARALGRRAGEARASRPRGTPRRRARGASPGATPAAHLQARAGGGAGGCRGSGRSAAAPRRPPGPRPPPRRAAGRPRRASPGPPPAARPRPVGRAGLTVLGRAGHDLALDAHDVLRAQRAGRGVRRRRRPRGGRRAAACPSGRAGR